MTAATANTAPGPKRPEFCGGTRGFVWVIPADLARPATPVPRQKTGGISGRHAFQIGRRLTADRSDLFVAAVAKCAVLRVLAAAPGDFPLLGNIDLQGRKCRSLVRSVAKGLVLRSAARTPPVGAGFGIENIGKFLGNDGFGHGDVF
jgi:hypothetical protein